MSEEATNTTELTDEQVNELHDRIMSPKSNDIQMESANTPKTWELAEGVSASEEDLLNYAKKGLEYDKNMQDWDKQKSEFQPLVDKYKQVDEFAIQNPDWWTHVQQAYQNRDQQEVAQQETQQETQQLEDANLSPELQTMQNQLNEVVQFINSQKQEQITRQQKEEDSLLDAEINSVRESHPYMDFSTPDEKGFTLEQKVLKHAQEIGTGSFRAAFRDYAHDKLIAKAQEVGKENLGKTIEKQTKLGILGTSSKSETKMKSSNPKGKSYDDLLKEGLEELGIR
jgi:hypothetical protein